jgi:hypothetical protein
MTTFPDGLRKADANSRLAKRFNTMPFLILGFVLENEIGRLSSRSLGKQRRAGQRG